MEKDSPQPELFQLLEACEAGREPPHPLRSERVIAAEGETGMVSAAEMPRRDTAQGDDRG